MGVQYGYCFLHKLFTVICMGTTNFYWQQLSGTIGSFEELTVFIVQLNELGRVNLQIKRTRKGQFGRVTKYIF